MKRLEISYSSNTSGSMSEKHNQLYNDYCRGHASLLTLQGSTAGIGVPTQGVLYKFNGVRLDTTYAKKNVESIKQKKVEIPDVERGIIIQLGGTFEKIGDEDEAIGGGDQKVGTANQ